MDVSEKISKLINQAKEVEVQEALDTRDDWKRGTYAFEIVSTITGIGSLILGSAAGVFTDYIIYLNYATIVSQAISVSCKGLAVWCSKKYSEQASIVNSIVDSVKTGKYPTISLLPSGDRQSRAEPAEEKV
jgi:hypothetical protein